eukprot:TRINITY_DN57996_c0_g1_i1.p1 TRINITY_DN57996_c0_g1~~TRINITY_DN57996_c0_g1_i1.p1  ORF type:complete len:104 (+),score=6.74 TRINITY_DN57996_c0_g1_i1:60-371(+)
MSGGIGSHLPWLCGGWMQKKSIWVMWKVWSTDIEWDRAVGGCFRDLVRRHCGLTHWTGSQAAWWLEAADFGWVVQWVGALEKTISGAVWCAEMYWGCVANSRT